MISLKQHFKTIKTQINQLPDKLNFKIGEVGNIVGVPQHVLRYWEKEFPVLKPEKWANKQRLYFKKDIKILLLIKILLYEEKFSIEGLRKHLPYYKKQLKQYENPSLPPTSVGIEKKLQQLLHSISKMRSTIR